MVTGANALVSAVSPDHRATALNLVNLFFGLGGLATPFISANLFNAQLGPPLLHRRIAHRAHARHPGRHQNARAHRRRHFVLADVGPILGRPLLFLLGLFLFLYISCEVGVWNWLPRHLIAQGIPESRALNILSLGFALGLLIGRVGVSPILIHVPAITVTAGRVRSPWPSPPSSCSGPPSPPPPSPWSSSPDSPWPPSSPPPSPSSAHAFPRMTGTAIGFVITCGWIGLAVSSSIIGAIAGGDPQRLKKALLVIPGSAVLMVGLNLVIRATHAVSDGHDQLSFD